MLPPSRSGCLGIATFPPLDDEIEFPIHVERLRRCLPGWQQRRTILARDPLASVDGFHVLLRLLLRHVFGVNICHLCPDCDKTTTPCMDCSGSNAALLGGVFGRIDAVYVTIEAQKSTGSLHGHMQCFLQCLHQHTPLTEIFSMSTQQLDELRREYCAFQAHVGHSVYSGQTPSEMEAGIAAAEATWPEHEMDTCMTSCPGLPAKKRHDRPGYGGGSAMATRVLRGRCSQATIFEAAPLSSQVRRDGTAGTIARVPEE